MDRTGIEFALLVEKNSMRTCRIVLLALSLCALSSTIHAQETEQPQVVYKNKTTFPQIFRSGVPGSMAESCNPGTKCTGNGLYVFEKAEVGQIKECKLFVYVSNDTIRSCRIQTEGKEHNQELHDQVVKQFGEPVSEKVISEKPEKTLYLWPNEQAGNAVITTSLTLTKHKGEFKHWYQSKLIAEPEQH